MYVIFKVQFDFALEVWFSISYKMVYIGNKRKKIKFIGIG